MSFGSPHVGQISGIVLKAYQISQGYIKITIEVSGILWCASMSLSVISTGDFSAFRRWFIRMHTMAINLTLGLLVPDFGAVFCVG